LTQALLALSGGPFHTRIRLGQRRGYFRKPGELLRRPQADANRPHHRRPSNLAGSAARLVYMWLDALVGWLPKIGVPRRRRTLVVLERPFVDFAIDPRRYRLSTPSVLARALARLLPSPDLVLVLTAPARAGTRHRITRRHGTTRFVIPTGAGPLRSGLYRPGRRRDAVAAIAVEAAHRLRLGPSTLIDQQTGVAPAIAAALGKSQVTLA